MPPLLLPTMERAPTTSDTPYSLTPSQTIFFAPDDEPGDVALSPLGFVLAFVAIVTIPALIYSIFFAIRFPANPFRRGADDSSPTVTGDEEFNGEADAIACLKYEKETHVKDVGSECPVCLSAFADGEEIEQLQLCKHSFHATCIDMWLSNHSSCPICRATVAVKRRSDSSGPVPARSANLHQSLQDAVAMV